METLPISTDLTESEVILIDRLLAGDLPADAMLAAGLEPSETAFMETCRNGRIQSELMARGQTFVRGSLRNVAMRRLYAILSRNSREPDVMRVQVAAAKLVADINQMTQTRSARHRTDPNEPPAADEPVDLHAEVTETREQITRLSRLLEHQERQVIDVTPDVPDDAILDL